MRKEDNTDSNLEDRISNLEMSLETLQKFLPRINQELMGYLLILSLPMSNKRRLELSAAILKTVKLDDVVLKQIFLKYFNEGRNSEMRFDDLLEPLVNMFGFDRLWKTIDVEYLRKNFGEFAVLKWNELEKNAPCKKEVNG